MSNNSLNVADSPLKSGADVLDSIRQKIILLRENQISRLGCVATFNIKNKYIYRC